MANSNELIKTINAEKKQLREINSTLLAKLEEKEAYIGELLNSNSKGNEELHLKEEAINQAEALLKKLTKEYEATVTELESMQRVNNTLKEEKAQCKKTVNDLQNKLKIFDSLKASEERYKTETKKLESELKKFAMLRGQECSTQQNQMASSEKEKILLEKDLQKMQIEMSAHEKRAIEAESASEELAEYIKELETENNNLKNEAAIAKRKLEEQDRTHSHEINEIKRLSSLSITTISSEHKYETNPIISSPFDKRGLMTDVVALANIVKGTYDKLTDVLESNGKWLENQLNDKIELSNTRKKDDAALLALVSKQSQTITDISKQLKKVCEHLNTSMKINEAFSKKIECYKEYVDDSVQKCHKFIEYVLQQLYEEQIDTQDNFITKIKEGVLSFKKTIQFRDQEHQAKQSIMQEKLHQLKQNTNDISEQLKEKEEIQSNGKYKDEIIKLNDELSQMSHDKSMIEQEYTQAQKSWEVDRQCFQSKNEFLENEITGLKKIIEEAKLNLYQASQVAEKFRDIAMSSKQQCMTYQEKLAQSQKSTKELQDRLLDSQMKESSLRQTMDS